MKHILHDWDDERCVAILTSCGEALPPHGNVIIVDNVLPAAGQATEHAHTADPPTPTHAHAHTHAHTHSHTRAGLYTFNAVALLPVWTWSREGCLALAPPARVCGEASLA